MNLLIIYLIASTVITSSVFSGKVAFPCESNDDCKVISSSAQCIHHLCESSEHYDHESGTFVTKIGEPCLKNNECNVEESYCLHNKCTCKSGTVESNDKKTCLKVAEDFGSPCNEDSQCSATNSLAQCSNGVCSCGLKMHFYNQTCVPIKDLGESCSSQEECTVEYSECNNTCRCINRYVQSNSRCLLISKTILSPCSEDIQCEETLGSGAQCLHGFCNCRDLHQFKTKSNKCIRDLLLGEVCKDSEECHQPGPGTRRLECILGVCKCRYPYEEVHEFCVSGTPGFPPASALEKLPLLTSVSCFYDKDCKENSLCYHNTPDQPGFCQCIGGFERYGNKTFYDCLAPIKSIGSACLYDQQCEIVLGVSSECNINNQCACLPNGHFIESSNSCYNSSDLNQQCNSHENCWKPDQERFCTNGKCTCALNHHGTAAGKCVKSAGLLEVCETDESCLEPDTLCRVMCVCKAGYVLRNDESTCIKAATSYGEQCEQLSQCNTYLRHSICQDGKCICGEGSHRVADNCLLVKGIGDPCDRDEECNSTDGSVTCKDQRCTLYSRSDNSASIRRFEFSGFIAGALLFLIV